jgi:putative flippase GtrA
MTAAFGPQAVRFAAVGVANTAVGLGTIFALKGLAGWSDLAANLGGYALGLVCSFVLNRRWTFRHSGHAGRAFARFLAVFALAYGANLVAFLVLRDGLRVNAYPAHAIAMVVYTLVFFAGSRWFAFRTAPRLAA